MFNRTPIIATLLLLLAADATAQTSSFEVGLQGGPSLSWLRGNQAIDNSDALIGPAAFLTVERRFSRLWSFRAGAGYLCKGMRSTILFTDINGTRLSEGEVRSGLDYLVIPLMLRASFGERSRVVVSVGPYAGYLLKGTLSFKGGLNIPSSVTTQNFNAWDLGLSASLGWSVPFGEKLALHAEVRYDKGLTNISALPVVGAGSIRTNAIMPMLGCSYFFGSTAQE